MSRYLSMLKQDRRLVAYSTGNFGKNLLLGSFDVSLLFLLTDVLGVAPSRVSVLMLAVLVADLALDLGAGLLATWAQNHGIGYRLLISLGALPCAVAFALIYSMPLLGVRDLPVLAGVIILFRATYAVIDVPHNSLLARVASDSRARGRVSGYRTVFSSMAGVIIATIFAPMVVAADHQEPARLLSQLGVVGGLLFCGVMLFAAWSSQEVCDGWQRQRRDWSRMVFLPKLDRLFGAIALVALITGFATPVFLKMMLYLATYVLHQPDLTSTVLLVLTLCQLAGAALWITLVPSHDKPTLLAASHGVLICGLVLFLLAGGNRWLLMGAIAVIGVACAGVFMLPWSILADIIDFAEFRHGERRETAAFATILVILKAGGMASVAVIGWTLAQLGYVPGVTQTGGVVRSMQWIAFGVPVLGSLIAILTLRRLAVGHCMHARVVRANQARSRLLVVELSPTASSRKIR
ncbi:MFS transporter [Rugamonas sp. A1-17]|nr:MFS transporter [Rugamonas sp. A1-17]